MYCSTVPCGAPPPPKILDFTPTPMWLTAGMQEAPGQFRELTLQRLRKIGRERAAQQLIEMRKDPIAWQEFIDEIDAVTAGPIEDMEWQLGVASFLEDEDWTN